MAEKKSYTWDKSSRRYRNERGQFSSSKDVREVVNQLAATTAERMKELGQKVKDGKLSIPKFQAQMAKEIKNAHTAAAALAEGGHKQMSQSDFGKLGQQIKAQYKWLEKFAQSIPRKVSDRSNKIPSRAAMYGNAVIGTYENAVRQREKDAGMLFERRVLGASMETCLTCLAEAGKMFQLIGTLKPIGDSECKVQCKCSFEFGNNVK